jgi:hypothetical protein
VRTVIRKFDPSLPYKFLKEQQMNFLITYAESGDEIHFVEISMTHWETITNFLNKLESLSLDKNWSEVGTVTNELISFIEANKISSEFIQSYSSFDFNFKNITKIIGIPDLGC